MGLLFVYFDMFKSTLVSPIRLCECEVNSLSGNLVEESEHLMPKKSSAVCPSTLHLHVLGSAFTSPLLNSMSYH